MRQIARECETTPEVVRESPRYQVVGRLDEVTAARKPILRWTRDGLVHSPATQPGGRIDEHRDAGHLDQAPAAGGDSDLRTQFFTQDGVVKAVNGVSFTLNEGEALGLVGESGCGKSVSALSLMRLIPQPPGKIVSGEVMFDGRDLLKLKEDDMRKVRGNDIAMIFQDPMTSLNPVLTIGRQISEALELHKGMDQARRPASGPSSCSSWSASRPRARASTTTRTSSRAACASAS